MATTIQDQDKKLPRWVRREHLKFCGMVEIIEGKPMIRQRNRVVDIVDRVNHWAGLAAFGVHLHYSLSEGEVKSVQFEALIERMMAHPGAQIHVEAKFIA